MCRCVSSWQELQLVLLTPCSLDNVTFLQISPRTCSLQPPAGTTPLKKKDSTSLTVICYQHSWLRAGNLCLPSHLPSPAHILTGFSLHSPLLWVPMCGCQAVFRKRSLLVVVSSSRLYSLSTRTFAVVPEALQVRCHCWAFHSEKHIFYWLG